MGKKCRKSSQFFWMFFVSNLLHVLCMLHLEPISIKLTQGFETRQNDKKVAFLWGFQ